MNFKIRIDIKKQSQPELFMLIILGLPFMFGLLFELLHIPTAMKYLLDFCWLGLLVLMLINQKNLVKEEKILFVWIIVFFIFTLLVYIFNYQSWMYYLWGFRNNFRFYVVFFAFIYFFKKEKIKDCLNLLDKVFWVNAVVCLVQYFLLDKRGDFLGGLFGVERGCNGYANIFFIIIATKSVVYYLNKKESLLSCLLKCGTILILSAFAELKFLYIEFAIVIVFAVIFTGFTFRKLIIALGALAGVWLGTNLLISVFSHSSDVFSWQTMLENATKEEGYSSAGDMDRLTAIPIISKEFLTTFKRKLFGLGLGNCDTASFTFLNTPFYMRYHHLRYSWFSTAFTFLETGFIGLTLFFGFFVLIFILTLKKKCDTVEDDMYRQISMIVSVACIFFAIYGSSLRMESGYMVYFFLALPFIQENNFSRKKLKRQELK